MKHLLTLFILVASVASVAQTRVLTTSEKITLMQSQEFQNECYFAIKDFANYWSVNDGSGPSTEDGRIEWAKNRILAVKVLTRNEVFGNPNEVFINIFAPLSLAYGESPSVPDIISMLLNDSPNRFEQAAAEYFKIWGDDVNMSVGGN